MMRDNYTIQYIDDEELPADVDWAFAETRGGDELILFLKRSAVAQPCVLAECWGAFRQIARQFLGAAA